VKTEASPVNPGAAGLRRLSLPIAFGMLALGEGGLQLATGARQLRNRGQVVGERVWLAGC
jgi:hypothetical protein